METVIIKQLINYTFNFEVTGRKTGHFYFIYCYYFMINYCLNFIILNHGI